MCVCVEKREARRQPYQGFLLSVARGAVKMVYSIIGETSLVTVTGQPTQYLQGTVSTYVYGDPETQPAVVSCFLPYESYLIIRRTLLS